jgi:hypothetical protein
MTRQVKGENVLERNYQIMEIIEIIVGNMEENNES